jgi:hypothetical protein
MFIRSIDRNCGAFSKDCVELFKILLQKTDSKFVVSSSWRARGVDLFDVRNTHIHEAFEKNGFENWRDFVAGNGVTKHLDTSKRGDDIKQWMLDNTEWSELNLNRGYGTYVIIDDDSDMLEHQYPKFVQTDGVVGLRTIDISIAARILGKKIHWNME